MSQRQDLIDRLMVSEEGWYDEHAPGTPYESRNSIMRDAANYLKNLPEEIVTSVLEMKTSAGSDYFVQIKRGTRSLTHYKSQIKGRTEYSVAEFEWLFHGGQKPRMADWLDRT